MNAAALIPTPAPPWPPGTRCSPRFPSNGSATSWPTTWCSAPPVAHLPYPGRAAIVLVLTTVNQVFQEFRYHRSFVSEDGHSVVLEFSAQVDGKQLKGIDMIRFDAQGKIAEFEVMIRPLSGLQALGAAMGARLASQKQVLTGAA